MKTSLYTVTIPLFIKHLQNLSNFIDKGVLHASTAGTDAAALFDARLVPDQYPFSKQVQLASDAAKGLAPRLKGQEPAVLEDTEATMEDLKKRIDKTIAILKEVKQEDVDGKEDVQVTLGRYPGKFITGFAFATEFALPNFFFHITTAYAILRHNGVALGKGDYLGNFFPRSIKRATSSTRLAA